MDTILLTGAAGRIGTLLREHWKREYRIVGTDLRPYDMGDNDQRYQIPVESPELAKVFTAAGRDAIVVHLAAVTADDAPWADIDRVNIFGTYNILQLARDHTVRRVIFASTNHVTGGYGDRVPGHAAKTFKPPNFTISADMPPWPDSLYAISKLAGERLAEHFFERFRLPTICLRIGSVTEHDGPRENPRLRSTWLSHRDCCHLFDCAIHADRDFGIYYGVSRNQRRFWDIDRAIRELRYMPQDDAEMCYPAEGGGP